jgi:hypothetical protein
MRLLWMAPPKAATANMAHRRPRIPLPKLALCRHDQARRSHIDPFRMMLTLPSFGSHLAWDARVLAGVRRCRFFATKRITRTGDMSRTD